LYRRAVIRGYNLIKIHFGIPDVLHAHSILMGGYGAIILKERFHIPVIVTEHVSFLSKFFSSSRKLIAYEVLYQADKFTAVSTYLANLINEIGRDQCEIIPNFLDKNKYHSTSYESFNCKKFLLLTVSSLISIKGIDILIRALDIVVHKYQYDNCFLDIIGNGSEKENFLLLVKNLSLDKYCTFHGEKSPEELSQFYLQANALVISSRSETFAIVGIEAMSVGKPIISTRCGGPEDYITPDVGCLVENENPEKLAEGIIYVINNYEKFSPQKIREKFLNNYSSDVVTEKWLEVYSEVCNNMLLEN
jgi:glycosyltransferase involved in cell wall biosynthesis